MRHSVGALLLGVLLAVMACASVPITGRSQVMMCIIHRPQRNFGLEWKRGAQRPPEFLSTHPSEATSIKQIEDWMPEAMTYYRPR